MLPDKPCFKDGSDGDIECYGLIGRVRSSDNNFAKAGALMSSRFLVKHRTIGIVLKII